MGAFLQEAADKLESEAKELPPVVRQIFNGHFPADVLDNARYAVGRVGITLPEVINGLQHFMGNKEHAVTVPGIIVFSIDNPAANATPFWWAHELQHIAQYRALGVQGFAQAYIKDNQAIEDEADQVAARILGS